MRVRISLRVRQIIFSIDDAGSLVIIFSVDDAGSLLIYELCHIFKWSELKKDAIFVED